VYQAFRPGSLWGRHPRFRAFLKEMPVIMAVQLDGYRKAQLRPR